VVGLKIFQTVYQCMQCGQSLQLYVKHEQSNLLWKGTLSSRIKAEEGRWLY